MPGPDEQRSAGPDPAATPSVLGASEIGADEPFAGVRRRTLETERTTVAAYTFEPGATFPIHTHAEEQITVILEGEVEFTVAGIPRNLGPTETFAVAAGVEHGLRAGPAGARFVAVVVPRRERTDAYEIKGDA
jgi:quercetin dioxygenase-like cupin family protein